MVVSSGGVSEQDAAQQLTSPSRRYASIAGRLVRTGSARVLVLAGHCDPPGAPAAARHLPFTCLRLRFQDEL